MFTIKDHWTTHGSWGKYVLSRLWYGLAYGQLDNVWCDQSDTSLGTQLAQRLDYPSRYFWSKVNIWYVNCARATAFIFETRTDVLVKVSKFLRQTRPTLERHETLGLLRSINPNMFNHLALKWWGSTSNLKLPFLKQNNHLHYRLIFCSEL